VRAIIPAAGLGKRMRAFTSGTPKELLSVGGKPVLQWVIDEAIESGADPVVVVSSQSKPELNAYVFGLSDPRVQLAFQEDARGLAHAVACAGASDSAALILMADSFYRPSTNQARARRSTGSFPVSFDLLRKIRASSPLDGLAERLRAGAWGCMAVRQLPIEQLHLYGVASFDAEGRVSEVVEKPAHGKAPSDWAVSGRFGLSSDAMRVLHQSVQQWQGLGEINLSVVLRAGLLMGEAIYAVPVPETTRLYDCGDPEGYEEAVKELGK
jgi:UTP--glucose-1-phosphate uridylyltransferase